jgi:pyruvate/2-oxoglutarate dehydrogenase complex dihydrolipoamide dehydrogenase (E3) component
MADSYDVVVIGGGPAGENVVDRAVRGGLTAAVVEERLVGGECSYFACIPSKALLRPVELVAAARRLPGAAEAVSGTADAAAVLKRRDLFVHGGDDGGQVDWLAGVPADLVRGRGRLAGERTVAVELADGGTTEITARQAVVLAAGTTPSLPPIPGLAAAKPWTNREATTTDTVPRRLVVLGGGVVAVEMAQAFRGLGAEQVTVVERGPRLLPRYPEFASRLLTDAMTADGIDVRTGVTATAVDRPQLGGEVRVTLSDGATVAGDELLAALGRRPGTADLGMETVGLEPGGYVEVDDTCRATGVPGGWLYAVGDVNGRNLLTHMGKYQARIAGDVIAARAAGHDTTHPRFHDVADDVAVPQVVFTDPQVCAVGRTEAEARDAGLDVRVVEYDIGAVSGASLLADGYAGRAQLVIDQSRRVVIGATFVGQDTAELVHAATVAIVGEVPLDRLWHAVPAFPTVSEIWLRLLETYGL